MTFNFPFYKTVVTESYTLIYRESDRECMCVYTHINLGFIYIYNLVIQFKSLSLSFWQKFGLAWILTHHSVNYTVTLENNLAIAGKA